MKTLVTFNTAILLLAASIRADDYSTLQGWFSMPEAMRGEVPASVTGKLKSAAATRVAAERLRWGGTKICRHHQPPGKR
jgi:hypothetical protein